MTHRSPVITAPRRFDAAGIAGEMRNYELRARTRGEGWSEWAETGNGDPVWFGGADRLQVRARGWQPRGTVHYVTVPSASIPAARGTAPPPEEGPPMPDLVSRRDWGANLKPGGCPPRVGASYGTVKAAYVHHTVSANDYTRAEAPGMVLAICRYHRNANRWNDIGYNALVDRFGNVYVGRAGGVGRSVIGAHAQGYNAQSTGIAALGTFTKAPLSLAALRGTADYLAWKLVQHGKTNEGKAKLISAGGTSNRYPAGTVIHTLRIIGHRRTGWTECPGDALNGQLGALRRRVQHRIDDAGGGGVGGGGTPRALSSA